MTLRERLRALPAFARPGLPAFDPDAAPATPHELFEAWLDQAIDGGLLAPHAATLSTADAAGHVTARTLVLKDVTADGWWFASQSTGPKGRDLAANPHAALTFFWPELGRQVKVTGSAAPAGPDASRADFLARPDASRAAGLVNRQSEPLGSRAEYERAFAEALRTVTADPELAAEGWTAYVLAPTSVEFWQAPADGPHTRLLYRADADGWTRGLLWP
ncbi:pyridoxal 5'-phosphate synthase [Promicromonospora thailandica]|uniref:Pyridoxamine 5'-phosphate oxidase n=1 Tax=Promicromonospora thailandica TaxID=765201 RepID=A0A9X2G6P9_9MICO|nr:pyridoxal 5'-phosphate synthase [Promicromonospora thailandica]MCP2264234.1 pyridoxamine 5'-phosphate oxidase [Promicromonospora thailandica]BFF21090.1 pyridoxal 5'-phosphate synthase [Promicromonospora thailandica]